MDNLAVNERYFEILISRSVKTIFGSGFQVSAHQMTVPSGRIDLLLSENENALHVLEIKKGNAVPSSVDQALLYTEDVQKFTSKIVQGWVVSHGFKEKTRSYAQTKNIRTLAISEDDCAGLIAENGLTEIELTGKRVLPGILIGGGVQAYKKNSVPHEIAVSELSQETASFLSSLLSNPSFTSASGKNQTTIVYKGIKIGGFNRTAKHVFITSALVLKLSDREILAQKGFVERQKTQESSSHVHVYWTNKLSAISEIRYVVEYFCAEIDRRLYV